MEKKKPNHKAKKNKTSFNEGNNAAEKWTEKKAMQFFEDAYEIAKRPEINQLLQIAAKLETYHEVFQYLLNKYPDFNTIKKKIDTLLQSKTYQGALTGEFSPAIAIFGLKNNHGWTDKKEVDHKNDGGKFEKADTVLKIDYNDLNENDD